MTVCWSARSAVARPAAECAKRAEPDERRIDPVEQILAGIGGRIRVFLQTVRPALPLSGQEQQLRRALALVHRPRFEAEFRVREAQRGVEARDVGRHFIGRVGRMVRRERVLVGAEVAHRLPRTEPFLDLLGILRGIAGGLERLARQLRRRLVMEAAGSAAAEKADDHVGPDGADVAHVVADDFVVAPLLDRLLDAERVAEVHRAREELLRAVEAVDGEQLLGARARPAIVRAPGRSRSGRRRRASPSRARCAYLCRIRAWRAARCLHRRDARRSA